jgi:signal transduction histidine kinase
MISRAGGTGLGLSLAREIIRAHGGELVLGRSEPDYTEFIANLPVPRGTTPGLPAPR